MKIRLKEQDIDIDFDEMIANETNSNIIAMHEYIRTVTPTNQNEYTGMFEGKNIIFILLFFFILKHLFYIMT